MRLDLGWSNRVWDFCVRFGASRFFHRVRSAQQLEACNEMILISCPGCSFSFGAGLDEMPQRCPRCGRSLCRTRVPRSSEGNIARNRLFADLREAFEFSALHLGSDCTPYGNGSSGSGGVVTRSPIEPGTRFDAFEVLGELGRGGMGVVYRARQLVINRFVALKVLWPLTGGTALSSRRFRKEIQAAARLVHPNIVPIYTQGEYDRHAYYAMKLIDGVSLAEAIKNEPEMLHSLLPRRTNGSGGSTKAKDGCRSRRVTTDDPGVGFPESVQVESIPRTAADFRLMAEGVAELAAALAHAHERGVIHRDIKPHNILVGDDRRMYVTDFGLASISDQANMTMTEELLGTPAYLSPEQLHGDAKRVDHRSDIYSLGVTLYELLTLRHPFKEETTSGTLNRILTAEPLAPRRIDSRIPIDLETICLKAMQKQASHRYQVATDMAADLRRFAEGLPIHGRRMTRVERLMRWCRRRPATAGLLATVVLSVVLACSLALTSASAKRDEANRLLQSAYESLAYIDYRNPSRVIDDVERAAELGCDPLDLKVVRAVIDLGRHEHYSAIERLTSARESRPNDTRLFYLLAWAHWRTGEYDAARSEFKAAEALGGPTSPDGWFFRALATHYDDPGLALKSYRAASATSAQQDEFYPQALLHMARAHNQRMYALRDAASFQEAERGLRLLVEHQQYGAYPHYLLSIAHRLYAEILRDSDVPGDAESASYHFDEALRWAAVGQRQDPVDDRPVTAEAECLESLGRLDKAIDARTRAGTLARTKLAKWEAVHYRWRLYFWLDRHEEALADLAACSSYDPDSIFYEYVYPALVLADAGRMSEAVVLARVMALAGSDNLRTPLWAAATLRLLNEPLDAEQLLDEEYENLEEDLVSQDLDENTWLRALYGYCSHRQSFESLISIAESSGDSHKLLAEAHFHHAVIELSRHNFTEAMEQLEASYRAFAGELSYTFHAKTLWQKMRDRDHWPDWLAEEPNLSSSEQTMPG